MLSSFVIISSRGKVNRNRMHYSSVDDLTHAKQLCDFLVYDHVKFLCVSVSSIVKEVFLIKDAT